MGLPLRSPILVGTYPLMLKPEMVRKVAIAGAVDTVMPSLMEEQVIRGSSDDEATRRIIFLRPNYVKVRTLTTAVLNRVQRRFRG